MTARNVPDSDLKPACLLLASCEVDLGKAGPAASEHYNNSAKWLRKVYGAFTPAKPATFPNFLSVSNGLSNLPPKPRVTPCAANFPSEPLTNATPLRLSVAVEQRSLSSSPDPSPKRKLDELAFERETRRKLERQLAAVTKERDHARKMESFAQEQVKREVETRKRAEDRAHRERELRLEVERNIRRTYSPLRGGR
jgi:hypothetical protein